MNELTNLAIRAVRCRRHWAWNDSMKAIDNMVQISARLPDFSDPGTVAELKKMVEKAHGGPVRILKLSDGHGVFAEGTGGSERCLSLSSISPLEAMIVALEAAQ